MELTNEEIRDIYDEYINIMNNNKSGIKYSLLEIEHDHVHALIKCSGGENTRYLLAVIKERYGVPDVVLLHSWNKGEYPLARIAFRCFCHEEPEELTKMWENNRQIALYSDEVNRLKAREQI